MAVYALISPTVYIAGYDATGDLNSLDGTVSTADLDTTTFASGGFRTRIAGLHDFDLNAEGFDDFAASGIDATSYPWLGSTQQVITISETDGTAAAPVLMTQGLSVSQATPVQVGDVATFKLGFKGHAQAVRGQMLYPKTSITSSSSGSVTAMTAATNKLYVTSHVFSASGSCVVSVLSGTTSGFGATTTQVTLATVSSVGATWSISTPVSTTNTFFKVVATLSGTNPAFTLAVGVGVL